MTTNLDMGGYRILNIAQPRDPRKKKEYESDLVTAKTPNVYMTIVEQNYMRRDRDGSLDGRLNMNNHRISGVADPTDADDAVTRRYVASRFQTLSDEIQDNKSNLDALLNLFGGVNNQILIRESEIIGTDFEHIVRFRIDEEGRNIGAPFLFRKYPHINEFRFFDMLCLKKILYIY